MRRIRGKAPKRQRAVRVRWLGRMGYQGKGAKGQMDTEGKGAKGFEVLN